MILRVARSTYVGIVLCCSPGLLLIPIEGKKLKRRYKDYVASRSFLNPLLIPNIIHATLDMMIDL